MNNIFCKELLSSISRSGNTEYEIEEMLSLYGYQYLEIIDEVLNYLENYTYYKL